jgi:putative membrane protein
MLTRDALLAYFHFMSIFGLATVLIAEVILLRRILPPDMFYRLRLVDRWYGIIAVLVVVSGLLRLNLGLKGVAFYTGNPVFWTKMGLFVCVGLLSIVPTFAYLRWSRLAEDDGSIVLPEHEFTRVRTFVWLEIGLFVFIPLCATFMARGL